MRLIVGLGNPGPEYIWTPHNLGFLAVDHLANSAGIRIQRPEAKAYVGRGKLGGHEVVLAKPQTMMNLSGLAVRELLERYEIGPGELIVIFDEVDLPLGMIRIRERGVNSTHNGLNSIIGALGTDEFARVRLGVRPEHPVTHRAAYVLRPLRKADLEVAAEMVERAGEAVDLILTEGTEKAMNRFNKRTSPPTEPV